MKYSCRLIYVNNTLVGQLKSKYLHKRLTSVIICRQTKRPCKWILGYWQLLEIWHYFWLPKLLQHASSGIKCSCRLVYNLVAQLKCKNKQKCNVRNNFPSGKTSIVNVTNVRKIMTEKLSLALLPLWRHLHKWFCAQKRGVIKYCAGRFTRNLYNDQETIGGLSNEQNHARDLWRKFDC